MVVAQPTDCELWSKVAPLITWPQSNEDHWADRAQAWNTAGGQFTTTAEGAKAVDGNLATGWTDQAGQQYRAKAAGLYQSAGDVGTKMFTIGWHAGAYADDVRYAKTQIADLIRRHESQYQDMTRLFFWPDNNARNQLAQQLATAIDDFLDDMADRIAARGDGDNVPQPVFVEGSGNDDPDDNPLTGTGTQKKPRASGKAAADDAPGWVKSGKTAPRKLDGETTDQAIRRIYEENGKDYPETPKAKRTDSDYSKIKKMIERHR